MSILGAHLELSSIVFVCSALPSVLQRNESESSEKSWAGCRKNHCKYEKVCIYFKIGKGGKKAESLWAFAWCARLTEVSQLTSQNFFLMSCMNTLIYIRVKIQLDHIVASFMVEIFSQSEITGRTEWKKVKLLCVHVSDWNLCVRISAFPVLLNLQETI